MALAVSIVITTFNRRELIARAVRSLGAQDLPCDAYEVIVVVNGSGDGTVAHLRGLGARSTLRVMEQSNRGQGAAKNVGLQNSRGDLVLFLDDDLICPPDLVREHVRAHGESHDLVVFGPIFTARDSRPALSTDWMAAIWEEHFGRLARGAEPEWPRDAFVRPNSSVRRHRLLASSGFDARLTGREDAELGIRLWKAGLRFRFAARAITYETFVKDTDALVRRDAAKHGRTEALLCASHPDWRCHSILARFRGSAGWKARLAWAAACTPMPLEPLIAAPCRAAEVLRGVPAMRRLGLRLVRARWALVKLRAAIETSGGRCAVVRQYGVRLPVLAYDPVGPSKARLARLDRHLAALARRGYVSVRPSDWLRWHRDGEPLPSRPLLITLDGEAAGLADHVLPLLRGHGLTAGVFVATSRIGGEGSLTAAEIRRWAAEGIEFGARGRTGTDLGRLGASALSHEVTGSADELADILGAPVTAFAYPPGPNIEVVRACVRRRFGLAFTRANGVNRLTSDPHRLARIPVSPDDPVPAVLHALRRGRRPAGLLRIHRLGRRPTLTAHPTEATP